MSQTEKLLRAIDDQLARHNVATARRIIAYEIAVLADGVPPVQTG